jgi:hypothetical protein
VDAHAHAERPGRKSLECSAGRPQGARRGREGNEEGIALRVDLDALARRERLTQSAAMFLQRLRVLLGPELVQQLRRTLDVREEERHRPRRELGPHPSIVSR